MSRHLVIVAKNPIPGTVKTRLQSRYSPEQAAQIYHAFIQDTLHTAIRVPVHNRFLACSPPDAVAALSAIAGPRFQVFPQIEADLGTRMHAALTHCFEQGAHQAILLGTDIPSLPANHLHQAFTLLSQKDTVLGPSTDGGYYLIGLTAPCLHIFQNIEWSTPAVLSQTVERIQAAGLSLGLLPPWYDVDTPEELDILLAHARALEQSGSSDTPRHTLACLSSLT
ncbi:MAG: TIGR04282 family arsenosugar biosynthesis glycosyltransferase [bacterium]|nr:TIGR04282 family arsenosugar biosynthesis glycosyltransferase [bacterium]